MIGLNLHNPGFVGMLGGGGPLALDGLLDTTFITNAGTGFTGGNGRVTQAIRVADGKILAVGDFTAYNGNYAPYIARINSDGSFDNTFNPGSGFNYIPDCVAYKASTGEYIVGGSFSTYNGSSVPKVFAIQPDGSRQGFFNPTHTFGGYSIIGIAVDTSGIFVAAGSSHVLVKLDGTTGSTLLSGISGGYREGSLAAISVVNTMSGPMVALAVPWNVPGKGTRYVILVDGSNHNLVTSFDSSSITGTINNLSSLLQGGSPRIMAGGFRPYLLTETGALASGYTLPYVFNTTANRPVLPIDVTSESGFLIATGSQVYKVLNDGSASSTFDNMWALQWTNYAASMTSIVTPLSTTDATQQGVVIVGQFDRRVSYNTGQTTMLPSGIVKLTFNYNR